MSRKKKPFDVEEYKGYKIVLPTDDWDEQYRVLKDDKELARFDNRDGARAYVDQQVAHADS